MIQYPSSVCFGLQANQYDFRLQSTSETSPDISIVSYIFQFIATPIFVQLRLETGWEALLRLVVWYITKAPPTSHRPPMSHCIFASMNKGTHSSPVLFCAPVRQRIVCGMQAKYQVWVSLFTKWTESRQVLPPIHKYAVSLTCYLGFVRTCGLAAQRTE